MIICSKHSGSGTMRARLSYVPCFGFARMNESRIRHWMNSVSVSRLSGRRKRETGANSPSYSAGGLPPRL